MSKSPDNLGNTDTGKSGKSDKARGVRRTSEPMMEGVLSGDSSFLFDSSDSLFDSDRLVDEPLGREESLASGPDSQKEDSADLQAGAGSEEPDVTEKVLGPAEAEESVPDEPVIEEPVIEEPIIEEPIIDERIIEEPVAESASLEIQESDEVVMSAEGAELEANPKSFETEPHSWSEEPATPSVGFNIPPPELLDTENSFETPSGADYSASSFDAAAEQESISLAGEGTEYGALPEEFSTGAEEPSVVDHLSSEEESAPEQSPEFGESVLPVQAEADDVDQSATSLSAETTQSEIESPAAEIESPPVSSEATVAAAEPEAVEPKKVEPPARPGKPASTLTKAWKADGIVPSLDKTMSQKDSWAKIAKLNVSQNNTALPSKPTAKDTGEHKTIKPPASTLTKAWMADGIVPKNRAVGEETGKFKAFSDSEALKAPQSLKDASAKAGKSAGDKTVLPTAKKDAASEKKPVPIVKPARPIKGIELVSSLPIRRDIGREGASKGPGSGRFDSDFTKKSSRPVPLGKDRTPVFAENPSASGQFGAVTAESVAAVTATDSIRKKFAKDTAPAAVRKFDASALSSKRVRYLGLGAVGVVMIGVGAYAAILSSLVAESNSQYDKKAFGVAEVKASEALKLYPLSVPAHIARGRALQAQDKDLKLALADLTIGVDAEPDNFKLRKQRAACAWRAGQAAITKNDVETMLKANGVMEERASLYALLAKANQELGEMPQAYENYSKALTLGCKKQYVYINRAWVCVHMNKLPAALSDLDTAWSLDPESVASGDVLSCKADVYRRQNKLSLALAAVSHAIKLNKAAPEYLIQRAQILMMDNKLPAAIENFSAAIKLDKSSGIAYFGKAQALSKEGNPSNALKALSAMPASVVRGTEFYGLMGRLYQDKGEFQKAFDAYEEASEKGCKDPNVFVDAAYCASRLNKFSESIKCIDQALVLSKSNARYQCLLGYYNLCLGNFTTAGSDLEIGLKLDPNNADAHLWYGDVLLNQNHPISAQDEYKKALSLNPGIAGVREKLQKLSRTLTVKQSSGKTAGGGTTVSRLDSVQVIKGDTDTLVKTGYMKMQKGDLAGAINYLVSAVRQDPNAVNARHYLAYALFRSGNFADAATQLSSLQSISKTTEDQMLLGKCWLNTGRSEDAIRVFEQLLQTNPTNAEARCSLATAYANVGFIQKAREVLDAGAKIDPGNRSVYINAAQNLRSGGGGNSTPTIDPANAPHKSGGVG